ncbi:hypothetical protein FO519_007962 [Halicephalobus sp. NKZ332]|nr:hypothetical protein FO519_007962 [Halicephalobus sp. NKZ332]
MASGDAWIHPNSFHDDFLGDVLNHEENIPLSNVHSHTSGNTSLESFNEQKWILSNSGSRKTKNQDNSFLLDIHEIGLDLALTLSFSSVPSPSKSSHSASDVSQVHTPTKDELRNWWKIVKENKKIILYKTNEKSSKKKAVADEIQKKLTDCMAQINEELGKMISEVTNLRIE